MPLLVYTQDNLVCLSSYFSVQKKLKRKDKISQMAGIKIIISLIANAKKLKN